MTELRQSHIPRKRFGQNFLIDQSVIQHIVATIGPKPTDHLVEIGPGQGALTRYLAESGADLTLVELDRDLIAGLRQDYGNLPQVHIINADALRTDFSALGSQLRVVGNLPYNISTPLLFHLVSQLTAVVDMHFMLQKEVVERITAEPGSGDWGRLGIMLQLFCQTEKLLDVPATAFHPIPKVESALVRLSPHPEQPDPGRVARLEILVRTAFNNRRKTLRNSLRNLLDSEQLEALGIDPQARPETLDIKQFLTLADALVLPSP